ncbi:hypothetical protein ABZ470_39790 [Streptosporangium sp. NPDC020072]|uniref:hypothetical protein n=1 Tax=Streptosporangium sp. NPDC020072 TaxID=3154788 RepID=UPI00344343A6
MTETAAGSERRRPPQGKKRRGAIGGGPLSDGQSAPVSPLVDAPWEEAKRQQDPQLADSPSEVLRPEVAEQTEVPTASEPIELIEPTTIVSRQQVVSEAVVLALPDGDLTNAPTFTVAPSDVPAEQLAHYETIIDGAKAAVDLGGQALRRYLSLAAGQSLYRIHKDKLVPNFEQYAQERFGWSRPHAYRVMYVGLCMGTWPDLQVDWTTKQAQVLGPIIREYDGDKARMVWDKAVELGDTSERGLRTAKAMVGFGADTPKGLPSGPDAPEVAQKLLSRFEGVLKGPEKEFDVSQTSRLRAMRDLTQANPEGAALLVLRMRRLAATLEAAQRELATDVGEELIEEVAARLKVERS